MNIRICTVNNKSKVFFNSVIVLLGVILENLIFLGINIIIARYLNLNEFGEYSGALAYATFFSTIANIGINQTMIRAYSINPGCRKEIFSSAFFLKCILSVAVYCVMALSLYLVNYSHNFVILTLIMGIFRLMNEFLNFFYSCFDAKEIFIAPSIFRISFSMAFLAITVFVVWSGGGLYDFVYLRLWLVTGFFVILLAMLYRNIFTKVSLSRMILFFRDSVSFGIFDILGSLFQRINIIFLSMFHISSHTAVFSSGFIFFTTLLLVPQNVARVLIPHMYKISGKDRYSQFRFIFDVYGKYMTIASFYLMNSGILFAGPVIQMIFGSKYCESAVVLRIIAAGIPFIFAIAPVIITALDRQRVLSGIYVKCFIISVAANPVLIYLFKAEGAAAASLVTYGYIFIASNYYLVKKGFLSLYDLSKIYVPQFIISATCFAVYFILLNGWRWLFSFAATTMLFIILNIVFIINNEDVQNLREIFHFGKSTA